MPGNGWWGGSWGIFPMMLMPLMMIVGVVLVLVVLRAVFGLRPGWRDRGERPEDDDAALRILRERYARGEITEDDFLDRKAMLEVRLRDRLRR